MGLEAVFAEIKAGLPDEVLVVGPGPETDEHGRAPQITWKPRSERHGPAKGLGTGAGDDGALWTRKVTLEVDIWGETFEDTEDLLGDFVAAVHDRLTQFSYQLESAVWDLGGVTASGAHCTLTMTMDVPLLRTKTATVTLGQVAITTNILP